MARRLWHWLVFFFTHPVRLSDVTALFASKKRPPAAPSATAVGSSAPITVPGLRPPSAPERKAAPRAPASGRTPSMFRPELEVGISEQPLDTLPADLRDELQRPPTGGIGARPGQS